MRIDGDSIWAGFWSLRMLLLFVVSIGVAVWGIGEYISFNTKTWKKAQGKLSSIELSERTRNKQPESVLLITYSYSVDGQDYVIISDKVISSEKESDKEKEEIKRDSLITVYYNSKEPNESTLDIKSMKIDNEGWLVGIITCVPIALLGFWGTRFGYRYLKEKHEFK